ncbi:hypothetical protein C8T65DRAFT_26692 [Cerioporus squamosus]|nr:hypothetical protein C8T65DRAFT_26692 [Cerioporus squamosus]
MRYVTRALESAQKYHASMIHPSISHFYRRPVQQRPSFALRFFGHPPSTKFTQHLSTDELPERNLRHSSDRGRRTLASESAQRRLHSPPSPVRPTSILILICIPIPIRPSDCQRARQVGDASVGSRDLGGRSPRTFPPDFILDSGSGSENGRHGACSLFLSAATRRVRRRAIEIPRPSNRCLSGSIEIAIVSGRLKVGGWGGSGSPFSRCTIHYLLQVPVETSARVCTVPEPLECRGSLLLQQQLHGTQAKAKVSSADRRILPTARPVRVPAANFESVCASSSSTGTDRTFELGSRRPSLSPSRPSAARVEVPSPCRRTGRARDGAGRGAASLLSGV